MEPYKVFLQFNKVFSSKSGVEICDRERESIRFNSPKMFWQGSLDFFQIDIL